MKAAPYASLRPVITALRRTIVEMDYVVYEKEGGLNFLCVPTEMKDRVVP